LPELADLRHEAFARGIAKGLLPEVAYRCAGYVLEAAAEARAAKRLLRNARIAARIAELKEAE